MRYAILLGTLCAGLVLSAAAGDLPDWLLPSDVTPEDYIREWLPLAEQGDVKAQFRVGRRYGALDPPDWVEEYRWILRSAEGGYAPAQVWIGIGCKQDFSDPFEAAIWYRRAAEQGDAGGQNQLAELLARGDGVAQDHREAAKWFRAAAEQGNRFAQHHLAKLCAQGLGVPQNFEEAAKWFRSAAERGYSSSQYELGKLYADGRGVPQDDAEAARWFSMASSRVHTTGFNSEGVAVPADDPAAVVWSRSGGGGHARAQYELAKLYEQGHGVPQNDQTAVALLNQAAQGDEENAQHALARRYEDGEGVSRDVSQALRWYVQAAAHGHADAQLRLIDLCSDARCEPLLGAQNLTNLAARAAGGGVADLVTLRQEAESGDAAAQSRLGSYYFHGKGVPQDHERAAYWLRKAAEQDHVGAQIELATLYVWASPPEQRDEEQAARWWRRAAELGNRWARTNVGRRYMRGRGVPRDLVEAYAWLVSVDDSERSIADRRVLAILASQMTPEQLEAAQQLAERRSGQVSS